MLTKSEHLLLLINARGGEQNAVVADDSEKRLKKQNQIKKERIRQISRLCFVLSLVNKGSI